MEALHRPPSDPTFSSSPAFGTPLHPIPPTQAPRPPPPPAFKPSIPTILPILLPPPTLRPLAFRTFTKKYNLTLNSSALQALATFIGRHCGSGWREQGTGEKVLEEVAKLWKAEAGAAVIVEDGGKLKSVLKTLEGCMSGGRVGVVKSGSNLSRQSSFAFGSEGAGDGLTRPGLDTRQDSFGMSRLQVEEEEEQEDGSKDPRAWMKVISAFEQPRLSYDMEKKHFVPLTKPPSAFPSPSHKTALFRERYNIIHQRLLRNPAFQAPSLSTTHNNNTPSLTRASSTVTPQQFYKITPIANLLGRGGTSHLLLGLLVIAPTGTLALNDLSGSISLDLAHATPLQGPESSYFVPGMTVLVDGVYEEEYTGAGSSGLGNTSGVGGTIGGRFIGFSIGGPPVEKRNVSLGVDLKAGDYGGGFGWTDFLGLGSERAVGARMRRIEKTLLSSSHSPEEERGKKNKMIILSPLHLDSPLTLTALRHILDQYSSPSCTEPPMTFLLIGSFTSIPALAGTSTGSVEYKELFNSLAAVLADYPHLLRRSTWIFVPGDNDAWGSAFSAGASGMVPSGGVPDVFTSRIKRVFAEAKREGAGGVLVGTNGGSAEMEGEAIWTSNPTRLSFFGPAHEVCVFRDDLGGRLRRNAIRVGQAAQAQNNQNHENDNGNGAEQDGDTVMSGALPTTEQTHDPETVGDVDMESSTTPSSSPITEAEKEARKTILTLLPQSTLSPFPLSIRPTHWDYTPSALSLYPLPHTLILADPEQEGYCVTFEGCHVINPGKLVDGDGVGGGGRRRRKVRWVEYDILTKRGNQMEGWIG